jgi:hypothetical protein
MKAIVFDFDRRETREITVEEANRMVTDNCREQGRIFASSGPPTPGQRCMCGETTYPRSVA